MTAPTAVQAPRLRSQPFTGKRALDVVLSAIGILLTSPLTIITAALIRIEDGGPILFTQPRVGMNEKEFQILKFRSMIVDADRYLDSQGNPTRDRVTRVGKCIRKVSIDELPQLANILKGDMSLVGPRPVPRSLLDRMTHEQRLRFTVRPGLTGLAQISGRHSLAWSQRISKDIEYVRNASITYDISIILRTPKALLGSDARLDRNASNDDL